MGLLKNGGFENTSAEKWMLTGTSASNVNTDGHHTGKYALKTWGSNTTTDTIGAQKQVSLHTANSHTLSAYAKTGAVTSFNGKSIYLKVTDNTNAN